MKSLPKEPTYVGRKAKDATLEYSFDWADLSTSIADSQWVVSPELTVIASGLAGTKATVLLSGGEDDTWYSAVNTVQATDGRIDQRTLSIYVKKAQPSNPQVLTALPKYTSYDQVRAILSVSDEELEDATLALPNFEYQLYEQMLEVDPGIQDLYLTLLDTPNRNKQQERFVRVAQVFSGYAVAVQLLDSLPLLAVMSEQDARAKYERFEKPFERVEAAVRTAFAVAKSRLIDAYEDADGTIVSVGTPLVMTRGVDAAYNPVTG